MCGSKILGSYGDGRAGFEHRGKCVEVKFDEVMVMLMLDLNTEVNVWKSNLRQLW